MVYTKTWYELISLDVVDMEKGYKMTDFECDQLDSMMVFIDGVFQKETPNTDAIEGNYFVAKDHLFMLEIVPIRQTYIGWDFEEVGHDSFLPCAAQLYDMVKAWRGEVFSSTVDFGAKRKHYTLLVLIEITRNWWEGGEGDTQEEINYKPIRVIGSNDLKALVWQEIASNPVTPAL